MNGTLAVARYTLLELSRRRILLVFFVIGALGIAAIGTALKILSSVSSLNFAGPPGSPAPDPAKLNLLTELTFVTQLISVIGFFAFLIAFAIGMTAIYHDLESGAAVSIFSKPVSRLAFTAGKLLAAMAAMVVIVGLLSLETRLVMTLFGGGLEGALWVETVAGVANAALLMLIVLALSTWMNNIIAAVVAFVYNAVGSIVVGLHGALVSGALGGNEIVKVILNVGYWLVPHQLMSDARRQLAQAEFDIYSTQSQGGGPAPTAADFVNSVPGASDLQDIIWWVLLVALMASLCYLAVRRRQV